jgi:hypothetical protein
LWRMICCLVLQTLMRMLVEEFKDWIKPWNYHLSSFFLVISLFAKYLLIFKLCLFAIIILMK